ncbi:uncharacterized protein LOC143306715 [Osmia lignaria lignaria]|uniref:uncharacterized protein LOC143306715 n=1 Tax=Osmia lignaria lignaria TaxID=1437193 RepID=UPI00402BBFC3
MNILQANINHCRLAHDMLIVRASEQMVDVVVVAEPYTVPESWFVDTTGRAAIYITKVGMAKCKQTTIIGCGNGFVGISYNGVGIISVYISPNVSHQEVENQFSALELLVKDMYTAHSKIFVIGDFNAKSPLWGSVTWCGRGRALFQLVTSLGLRPIIAEGGVTCERGAGTVIDILLGSDRALSSHASSVISEEFTASDHRHIVHAFKDKDPANPEAQDIFDLGKGRIDEEGLLTALLKRYGDENFGKWGKTGTTLEVDTFIEDVEKMVNKYTHYRRTMIKNRKPAYWWTDAVATKRKEVNKSRRKFTRAKAKGITEDTKAAHEIYKIAKKAMDREVKNAKKANWKELLSEIDRDA